MHWPPSVALFVVFLAARVLVAASLQSRLTRSASHYGRLWLVPVKDLLSAAIWALSFAGNRLEWRGQCYHVLPGGKLAPGPARENRSDPR
jgi:ceramide glucosyltransferase